MADKNELLWLFFSLKGRISPAAYFLAGLLLLAVRMFLFYRFSLSPEGSAAQNSWALILFASLIISAWANIALTGKRLHDFGKSAIWALITLVFDLLIFFILPFFKGDPGPNRYGDATNMPA